MGRLRGGFLSVFFREVMFLFVFQQETGGKALLICSYFFFLSLFFERKAVVL